MAGGATQVARVMAFAGPIFVARVGAVLAAQAIGQIERLKSTAYGTPPDTGRIAKQINDPLVFRELLETLSFSALEASLLDGSVLTLGASARVTLDEFVYDPSSAKLGTMLDMTEGALRFVTGDIPKESFQVRTPLCTIAIRGTNFKVRVRPNGDTLVAVDQGSVLVNIASSGEDILVNQGESVEIIRSGAPAAPVDTANFTDDKVLLVGDQIVDFGWGQPIDDEASVDGAEEEGEPYLTPTKPKMKESDSGKDGGGEGGD